MRESKNTRRQADGSIVWGVCGFLLLAVGLIYGQTLAHQLLGYDDNGFVYDNPKVTAGLTGEGIWWAFTDGPYGEWYPVTPLSHMLDCQLYGLNAWGHHLTSVLLHAATSIALFFVLRQMTGEDWPSAFVAAVFAVHPQHVESVAWVSERRDVLSGLFFMLALGAYLGYVSHGRSLGRYLLVAMLFAIGLMSKPMIVTLPPLLLLLDFWPLARTGAAGDTPEWTRKLERPSALWLVLEKLPLVALSAGDCLMTLRTHFVQSLPTPWSVRIGNAAVSCVDYVVQFFYPVGLAAIYPVPPGGPPAWKVAGALTILAVGSAAAVIWRRKYPYLFVGWFWYLGMLSPVLGLIRVAGHARADRYMYLPGIGLCIALVWGTERIGERLREGRRVLALGAGLAIVLLAACAARQTSFWRDDETLWRHTLALTTDNTKAEIGLGYALAQQRRFDEAVMHYDRALAIEPDSFLAHANLGVALSHLGRPDESVKHLRRAIELDPRAVATSVFLASVLVFEERVDEAHIVLEKAIAIDPQHSEARTDLGSILLMQGKIDAAISQYEAALASDPNFVLARVNLGSALAARGNVGAAIGHFRRALELDPNNPKAHVELDRLFGRTEPSRASNP